MWLIWRCCCFQYVLHRQTQPKCVLHISDWQPEYWIDCDEGQTLFVIDTKWVYFVTNARFAQRNFTYWIYNEIYLNSVRCLIIPHKNFIGIWNMLTVCMCMARANHNQFSLSNLYWTGFNRTIFAFWHQLKTDQVDIIQTIAQTVSHEHLECSLPMWTLFQTIPFQRRFQWKQSEHQINFTARENRYRRYAH